MNARIAGERMRHRIVRAVAELEVRLAKPPTVREICAESGGISTGHCSYHLARLVSCGTLEHDASRSRGYRLARPASEPCPSCALLRLENARLLAQLAALQERGEIAS